ncbi:MAG TPA: hypothetical protein VFU90_08375 [Candidatus Tumulicola sp.]|nr:hypothetical protein [Candidatus Tumulicola sp.]
MTKKKEELPPYHELFELPEGETPQTFAPPPNFSAIKLWVKRFGPNGLEECPRPWLLSEIPDRASFFDMFGGGRYEVEGRTLGGQFYARRTFVLVGDPKPLVPRSASEDKPAAAPAAGGFSMPTGGGGDMASMFAAASGNPMALLFLVMMQNADRAEQRADRQANQSVEMFKAIATIMGGQSRGTDPAIANVFGSMTELVKAGIQQRPAEQPAQKHLTVEEEIARAKQLIELARKTNPDEKPERIVDILKEIVPMIPPQVFQGLLQPVAGAANGSGIIVEQAGSVVGGGSVG